jgi:signal transduction histidine kinase
MPDEPRQGASESDEAEWRLRTRVAHRLHDQVQQLISAAKLKVGMLRRRSPDGVLMESLREVENLMNEALIATQSLAGELSQPAGTADPAPQSAEDHSAEDQSA